MMSKPSAYACIMPYSIPLWTIFTKWPAPDGPQSGPFSRAVVAVAACVRAMAPARRQRLEDRLELLDAVASPPIIRQ